jgi:hypothetical protein
MESSILSPATNFESIMPKPKATFEVYFKIKLDVGKTIAANSFEEAITAAKALTVTDVVDLDGLEYNDGEIEVSGIYVR